MEFDGFSWNQRRCNQKVSSVGEIINFEVAEKVQEMGQPIEESL